MMSAVVVETPLHQLLEDRIWVPAEKPFTLSGFKEK